MVKLSKLQPDDKVAILSPSFAAPGKWPHVYELGLKRLREVFALEPVEYPTTKVLGASAEARAKDLIAAFEDSDIKAVISTIGGDDQVTYVKNLPPEPFAKNPKPYFGYSDNSHFENFLWLNGIPSFYGGSLFTQIAMQGAMDEFTVKYLKHALFDEGEYLLESSPTYNDVGLDWGNVELLGTKRQYEPNEGPVWSGSANAEGLTWGGCVESIDEMLRHDVPIPTLEQFKSVVLIMETSEEIPSSDYVHRVYRALGERGILERVRAVLVGRSKAWEFDKQWDARAKEEYREDQRDVVVATVRKYNQNTPIVQNLDFGHTDPQIPIPYGAKVRIDGLAAKIFATF